MRYRMPSHSLTRREFVGLCAIGAAAGALAACAPTSSQPTPTPTSAATATPPGPPTDADWSTLASSLKGTLIRSNSAQYANAHLLYNTRFDGNTPAAIAYCASPADAQACVNFARRFALPVAPRSGGHSYAGYSSPDGGLVIDVTRMNAVNVNTSDNQATIGAGAFLIDIYSALANNGLVLPGGSCPTVGIAGLTLGGGVGVIGRKFGLTCDSLIQAQVVTADGSLLTCDGNTNEDLFWALRGGGGGNFGVVTQFTFQTYPVSTLTLFTYNWPWSAAATVFDAWQRWAPTAPDELWSNCLLLTNNDKSGDPIVRVNGVYVGGAGPVTSLVNQLVANIGIGPSSSIIAPNNVIDTMLIEAGCYGQTVAACHLPGQTPQGQLPRDTSYAKSDYFTSLLPTHAINMLVSAIANRQSDPNFGPAGFGFDASGGAINRIAADATAFVHRDTLFSAQYSANWQPSDSASTVSANMDWVTQAWQSMRSYASGQAYQNYIDPNQPDWGSAYYGANFTRLQRVKTTYDPNNLFAFAQGITPA